MSYDSHLDAACFKAWYELYQFHECVPLSWEQLVDKKGAYWVAHNPHIVFWNTLHKAESVVIKPRMYNFIPRQEVIITFPDTDKHGAEDLYKFRRKILKWKV